MNLLVEWVDDWLWAMSLIRARACRRQLSRSKLIDFDHSLRPRVGGVLIGYPDAIYYIGSDDVTRAMHDAERATGAPLERLTLT
jgi:hypothetical protein